MKWRKFIKFILWVALSLAVAVLATYAIDRATGFRLYFKLRSFPFSCGSVQEVVPSPTGHATAYDVTTGFIESSQSIRVCKRFQIFPRGVFSHSVSENTVSELRKVQTERDYGKLEWSQDGSILAYSRGGIFVAAYDFNVGEQIALRVSHSKMIFPDTGEVKKFVNYQEPKTAEEFRELDCKIREAMKGRTRRSSRPEGLVELSNVLLFA